MYTNFAESVFKYFQNRMDENGQPLNETETQIFRQAEKCIGHFPISCLTKEDLEKNGYSTNNVNNEQLQRLASKLGDDYHEQLFLDSLDSLAYRYGLDKRSACAEMRYEYEQLLAENDTVSSVAVIIQDKNNNKLSMVTIGIGQDGKKDAFFNVRSFDELCGLFEKENGQGFYIKEHVDFQ